MPDRAIMNPSIAAPRAPLSQIVAPYIAVSVRAFRQFATYRGATVAGVVTNTIFGFLYVYVFVAVHDRVGTVDGFTAEQTATFVFAAQGFLMMTGTFGDREISERIRTGDIAADLYRPVDFQLWWLAHDQGKAAFYALGRGVPPFVIGMLALGLPLPRGFVIWTTFLVAAFFGVVLAFAVRFLVNLTGFWLLDAQGVVALTAIAQSLFAGHIVPLYFMPDRLELVARLSPFAGITAHPVELLIGAHDGWGIVAVFAHQFFWLVVLLGAGRIALGRARRKLVIQGG